MKQLIIISALVVTATHTNAQGLGGYMLDSVYTLPEAKVTEKFKNDTDRYHYNQTKYYVTTILPYLNAATKLFVEMNKKVNEPGISKRERKEYVHAREEEVRTEFEERIKKLNVTQGALLVKLLARQSEVNIYEMLQEFKNPLTAVKWQTWARFNGLNLDKKYDPEEEPMLEHIMDDLGYPLPIGYRTAEYANGRL